MRVCLWFCIKGLFPALMLILCSLLPAWGSASADDKPPHSEETLFMEIPSVFGASKFEQKVNEAPSSVSIITQAEIKKYGYRTLADLLRSVRGFFTTYDRNYSYIGVRGFGRPGDYNTRVLLLVDGHRINDNVYDQAPISNDFPVDIDLIEKVEIIRGPSSSIYGTNAFLGVINILTRRGRDLKGIEVSGEAGRFDAYKGRASYGNRYSNGLELLLSGSYSDSRGPDLFFKEFNNPLTNRGIARGCDWENFHNVFSKVSFQDFTLEGVYSSRDKGIPTAPWESQFNDSRTATTDERAYLDFKYERSFSNDFSLMSRFFYDRYSYDGTYPYNLRAPGAPPLISMNKDRAEGEWFGGEVQFTKKLFEGNRLLAGVEFQDNFRQDQRTYDERPFFSYLDSHASSFRWAIYAEDQYQLTKGLILNAGLRYDHFETFGDTLNPRLALIYNPFAKTTFKLIYGEAFRAPNAYEMNYGDGQTQKAARNLRPEKIQTYEAVWEQYIGEQHRMTMTGYYFTIDDLINLSTDPADNLLVFKNIDTARGTGIEWEFETKWKSGIESRLSYACQRSVDESTHELLTNSPVHQAKLNLSFPVFRDKAFLSPELQYLSPRKTIAGKTTDDVVLANVTVYTQNFWKGLEMSASIYNLFNQKYGEPGSAEHIQDIIFQDGIGFRVKVTYSF